MGRSGGHGLGKSTMLVDFIGEAFGEGPKSRIFFFECNACAFFSFVVMLRLGKESFSKLVRDVLG